jgi:hypothetical protein
MNGRNEESLPILDAVRQTDLCERPADERAQPEKAAMSTLPVLPATPTFPDLSTSNAMIAVFTRFRSS